MNSSAQQRAEMLVSELRQTGIDKIGPIYPVNLEGSVEGHIRLAEIDGWNQAIHACIRLISDREGPTYVGPFTRETLRRIADLRITPEPET